MTSSLNQEEAQIHTSQVVDAAGVGEEIPRWG